MSDDIGDDSSDIGSIDDDAHSRLVESLLEIQPQLADAWERDEDDALIHTAIGRAAIHEGVAYCLAGVQHSEDELDAMILHVIHLIDGFVFKRLMDDEDETDDDSDADDVGFNPELN
jgi:hypothetical protein